MDVGSSTWRCPAHVGARSAVLLPLPRLGLIVVDEEHEPSFNSTIRRLVTTPETWRCGWLPGKMSPCPRVGHTCGRNPRLGEQGFLQVVPLTERFAAPCCLKFSLADLRKEHKQRSMRGGFSKMLRDEMDATLKEGRQVILFQNRRGYAPAYINARNAATQPRANGATSHWWHKRWEACIAITAGTTNARTCELHLCGNGAETAAWHGAH